MKKIKTSIFLLLIFLSSCRSNPEYLDGIWSCYGYSCNGNNSSIQTVDLDAKPQGILATKLTGDQCIPANEVLWGGGIVNGQILGFYNDGLSQSEDKRGIRVVINIINSDSLVMDILHGEKAVLTFGRIKK